jgi:putative RecB family exonuclease
MYLYEYERGVTTAEQTRALEIGRALHETIRETCDHVRNGDGFTDHDIRSVATEEFERQWDIEVARESYRTKAHYEDDRRLARESITHFFEDGAGVDHARQSVAAEIRVEFERNGVAYSGYIDNVLRTDEGLELIDYKKSTIAPPVSSRKNYIELQDEGEYRPQRVKNAIQAVLYMNGIKETEYYEPGDEVAFTYQPLAEATIDRKGAKISFEFDTEPISVEADIRENSQTVWRIIERAVEEIRNEAFDPAPFGEIKDDQCDRCRFRTMCSEYLSTMEHKL